MVVAGAADQEERDHGEEIVHLEAAKSVAGRELPSIPNDLADDAVTICLCYQYKEPPWTSKEHKKVMSKLIQLAHAHGVTGRGRCAPEGLNCTLTSDAVGMRKFCEALREFDSLFMETDFKLEDGLKASHKFKSFSLRKTDELVNYGLEGLKAPSLQQHVGTHLEAHQYHEAMKDPNAIIIDVRNAYESAIGHFQPPKGGATLLDPQMRNSSEFPKWLNSKETKEKLQNKKVMMYCTGGIRCERATALLNQMTEASKGTFQTDGDVVMVRGGIERYLKTFPKGGYWKGKNYLFDKRMEQVPSDKSLDKLKEDIESHCCVCHKLCGSYRGQFKCFVESCRVPVIVCNGCTRTATEQPQLLKCPLCVKGYQPPTSMPNLIDQKRQLGLLSSSASPPAATSQNVQKRKLNDNDDGKDSSGSDNNKQHNTEERKEGRASEITSTPDAFNTGGSENAQSAKPVASHCSQTSPKGDEPQGEDAKEQQTTTKKKKVKTGHPPSRRLFVGKLPLTVTASKLRQVLLDSLQQNSPSLMKLKINPSRIQHIEWITDHKTGAFYGSAFVTMLRVQDAQYLVDKANIRQPQQQDQTLKRPTNGVSNSDCRKGIFMDDTNKRRRKTKRGRKSHRPIRIDFGPDPSVSQVVISSEIEYPPIGL